MLATSWVEITNLGRILWVSQKRARCCARELPSSGACEIPRGFQNIMLSMPTGESFSKWESYIIPIHSQFGYLNVEFPTTRTKKGTAQLLQINFLLYLPTYLQNQWKMYTCRSLFFTVFKYFYFISLLESF